MKNFVGIIGGSGVYSFDAIKVVKEVKITTPFGDHSGPILEIEVDGHPAYFLPRHGVGHTHLPSEVNYRANIFALKKLGVRNCISISAVGSLEENCPPESFVLPDQFIDWTKGKRERTFFGKGIVAHVSTAYPVELELKKRISKFVAEEKIKYKDGGSYICIEGPQFSSRAESNIYRSFGATVIGMTNVPESYLAKEAGMAYATIAMVTDYDCWKEVHCNVDEIMKVMKKNYLNAQNVIKKLIPNLYKDPVNFSPENKIGIMTPMNLLSKENKEIVEVLIS